MHAISLELTRYYTPGEGTFGKLTLYKRSASGPVNATRHWYTLECNWERNAPFISCIPQGTYRLVPGTHNGVETWSIRDGEVVGRYGIDIHPANTVDELQGCIALGTRFGYVNKRWAILGSKDAQRIFLKTLEDERDEMKVLSLRIRQFLP